MARSHPNAEFVLVGDGPLRQEFETECQALEMGERVRFLGDVRDIPAILASLDVSIVPSDSESLSNVILESMAAGLPVIATRVGGNPELVNDDRGILVPGGDVDALVNAISQLLENVRLRESLGRTAKAFAREYFSAENVTAQYEALYSETLYRKLRQPSVQKALTRDRLRVAIVAPSLRYVGGQAVQADLLLRQWRDDHEVRTTFVPVDPPFPAGLGWVAKVPMLRTVVRAPFYWAALWRGLRDADVVHIFSASYSSFLVAPFPAWLAAKMRGKKMLINYRSGEARDHLRHSRIARGVLRRADRVIAPNGYLVDVFGEFRLRAQAIPNTVDTTHFTFRQRLPLRPHLVCTRGFHPYYCIDVVVKAFAEVRKVFPAAQLDLVGGGPLEPQIRTLVSELNIEGVNFCGTAARNEIAEYYKRADIFINASRVDNMPVSVLEAFASGTPVVSTGPESMRYLVEHGRTGLLSKPGDAEALAQNVIRILRDSDLAQRLISNALLESRKYEWANVRDRWLQIYRELGNVNFPVNEFDRAISSNGVSD
jgi:glycosyltransferase involved in cell wall biosynthesis